MSIGDKAKHVAKAVSEKVTGDETEDRVVRDRAVIRDDSVAHTVSGDPIGTDPTVDDLAAARAEQDENLPLDLDPAQKATYDSEGTQVNPLGGTDTVGYEQGPNYYDIAAAQAEEASLEYDPVIDDDDEVV